MKKYIFGVIALACAGAVFAPDAIAQTAPANVPAAEIAPADSASVAVGTVLGDMLQGSLRNLARLGLTVDHDVFVQTVNKVLKGEPTGFTAQTADMFVQKYIESLNPQPTAALSIESQDEFINAEAAKEGAIRTPKGVVLQVITEGEGQFPTPNDKVKVAYVGRLADGTVFDDSQGQPVEFPLDGVVPGFSDGIQHMRPGGKYRIIFPASMGYGENGIPGVIPGNAALDFTVDLLEIVK